MADDIKCDTFDDVRDEIYRNIFDDLVGYGLGVPQLSMSNILSPPGAQLPLPAPAPAPVSTVSAPASAQPPASAPPATGSVVFSAAW